MNDLASAANEVQDHLERIRHLCEDLLNKNVDSVKRLNIRKFESAPPRALEILMTRAELNQDNAGML